MVIKNLFNSYRVRFPIMQDQKVQLVSEAREKSCDNREAYLSV